MLAPGRIACWHCSCGSGLLTPSWRPPRCFPDGRRGQEKEGDPHERLDDPADAPLDYGGEVADLRAAGGGCRRPALDERKDSPALAAVAGISLFGGVAHATRPAAIPVGGCTIAAPPTQATVEARIAYADDFCELLSTALAGDVFHAAVVVTPSTLWHYAGAAVSCHLRFGQTADLTIRNSPATCLWLARHGAGWQFVNLEEDRIFGAATRA